jgi:hypothetical protein
VGSLGIFGGDVFGVVSRGRMAAVELRTDLLPLRRSGSSLAISEGISVQGMGGLGVLIFGGSAVL